MDDAGLEKAGPEGASRPERSVRSRLAVRRARPEELAACAQIYVRVLTDTFTWVSPDRHREEDFLRAARDEEVFVAVDGAEGPARIVGMAALYRPQRFLHSLYVTERGRGIGKLLLDHVVAATGGVLALKCQAANKGAQAFYVREGFRCIEAGEDGGVAWLRFVRR
ncbi:GNAT family N-acetyltransferase [uncultured Phenylobacterium sp.]|uniref:GNAT family N-acetyltransferase n=1 Tax=uncultured Phenylobacterium sp. TaxID=349273 RepID=UPI0025D6D86D|nr:GNAT family N-acetyltransferase [uncultured Phenylobacterium sp.]